MGENVVKIKSTDATLGMFVSDLDRPWEMTPFPIRGFYIRDLDEIKRLKAHCEFIFIDTIKGVEPIPGSVEKAQQTLVRFKAKLAPIQADRRTYAQVEPLVDELANATERYDELIQEVSTVMGLAKQRQLNEVAMLKHAVKDSVDSVLRNPDAMMWVARIRINQDSPVSYLVRTMVWCLVLGRHLGVSRGDLTILALAAVLKDIGKTQFPKALNKPDFEAAVIDQSVAMLRSIKSIPPKIVHTVRAHRERINGSGIPQGQRGDDIFFLAKLLGVASFYNEVIHPERKRSAISPSQAVARLYEVRGVEFQDDLVVEFIRAIGLFTTGTLVELSTGEIGFVSEQNYERRLLPKVMVCSDSQKKMVSPYIVDLCVEEKNHHDEYPHGQKLDQKGQSDSNKASNRKIKIEIVQDLELDSFEFDLDVIRSALPSQFKKKKSFFSFLKKAK